MDREDRGAVQRGFFTTRGRRDAEQVRRVERADHAHARRADAHVHEVDEARAPRAGPRSPPRRRARGREPSRVSSSPTRRTPTAIASPTAAADRVGAPRRRSACGRRGRRRTRRCGGCCAARGTRGSGSRARRGSPRRRARRRRSSRPSGRSRRRPPRSRACSIGLRRLHVVRDERRRPGRQLRPRAAVDPAVVRELEERERAVLVHRVGHLGETRHRGRRPTRAALLGIWYAVVGCTAAWPPITRPAPPRANSPRYRRVARAVEAGLARGRRLGELGEVRARPRSGSATRPARSASG